MYVDSRTDLLVFVKNLMVQYLKFGVINPKIWVFFLSGEYFWPKTRFI